MEMTWKTFVSNLFLSEDAKDEVVENKVDEVVETKPADEPATESHNVYSSCVAQSFSNFHRKPLFSKQCNRNTKIPSG